MAGKQTNKYLIIVLIVVLVIGLGVAVGIYIKRTKKQPETKMSREIIPDSKKTNLSDSIIVSTPAGDYETYDLIIVWGGISYATPEWMYKQIPSDILYRDIVVIAPYSASMSKVEGVYKPFLKDRGYSDKIEKISIMGFSAGGVPVYKNYSNNYKVVGLIDPTTYSSNANLPFTDNTIIVYNERNWGGFPNVKAALPVVADSIGKKGGTVERVGIAHADIPKYFFNKYIK